MGKPNSPLRQAEVIKLAESRFSESVPPGYEDKKKDAPRRYGDVVLWFQLKEEAASRKAPLVFVTDERKQDWWLQHEGQTIGPRPELIEEFLRETGQAFYMYSVDGFLVRGQEHLNIQDKRRDEAVQEIRQVPTEVALGNVTYHYTHANDTSGPIDPMTWEHWQMLTGQRYFFQTGSSPSSEHCRALRAIGQKQVRYPGQPVALHSAIREALSHLDSDSIGIVLGQVLGNGWIDVTRKGFGRLSKLGEQALGECMATAGEGSGPWFPPSR